MYLKFWNEFYSLIRNGTFCYPLLCTFTIFLFHYLRVKEFKLPVWPYSYIGRFKNVWKRSSLPYFNTQLETQLHYLINIYLKNYQIVYDVVYDIVNDIAYYPKLRCRIRRYIRRHIRCRIRCRIWCHILQSNWIVNL